MYLCRTRHPSTASPVGVRSAPSLPQANVMKKIYSLASLLLFLGLFLCLGSYGCTSTGGKGTADSTSLQTLWSNPAQWDSIDISETYFDFPQTKTGSSVDVTIHFLYPKTDTTLQQLFCKTFFGEDYARLLPSEAMKRYVEEVKSEYLFGGDSLGFTSGELAEMKSGLSLQNKIHYSDSLVLAIEKNLYTHSAGAIHGLQGLGYYNIGLQGKEILSEGDIFVDGYVPELTKIIQSHLLKTYGKQTAQELEESEGIYISDLTPNDNFAIGPKGLTYCYNPYEIAPYAVGIIQIFIPYEALTELLRPGSILHHYIPQ